MRCWRVVFLCLMYGALFVPYSAEVQAAPYEVGVMVNTTTFAPSTVQNYDPEFYDSGPQSLTSLTHAVSSSSSDAFSGSSASANASATASIGSLTGLASASAAAPLLDALGRGVVAQGTAQVSSFFLDTFSVVSSTLAHGTPVDLLVTATLEGIFTTNEGVFGANANLSVSGLGQNNSAGSLSLDKDTCSGFCRVTGTGVLHTAVGFDVTLQAQLSMILEVSTIIGAAPIYVPNASGSLDFTHTALINIDSLTSGADYTTASGVDLHTPPPSSVPEPASVLLLSSGVIGLVVWRRMNNQ